MYTRSISWYDIMSVYPDVKIANNTGTSTDSLLYFMIYKFYGMKTDLKLNVNIMFDRIKLEENTINICLKYTDEIKRMEETPEGFERLTLIEKYYNSVSGINSAIFVSKERKRTNIYLDKQDNIQDPYYHQLISLLPSLIPWETANINDENTAFANMFIESTPNSYITEALNHIKENKDIQDYLLDKKLNIFATICIQGKIDKYQEKIDRLNVQIEDYLSTVADFRRQAREYYHAMSGIKYRNSEETNALNDMINYIKDSDNISIAFIDPGRSLIDLDVTNNLSNWEEDTIETMIENHSSYFYYMLETKSYYDPDKLEKFWRKIFIDETIKVPMHARYTIDLDKETVANSTPDYYMIDGWNILPNPHIYHFNCFGTVNESFNKAFWDQNYQEVVMLCTVSAGSLNTDEAPTTEYFVRDLFETGCMIETDRGRMSAIEYYENYID